MRSPTFTKYVSAVRDFTGEPLDPSLLLAREGALSVYYAPFEWVNLRARVVLVGITPGRVQAANALAEAKRALLEGSTDDDVLRRAKATGAFSGPMRPNLIALMDCIGLNNWLGLTSCVELFGGAADLLQTASILQFPVFQNGENYNGTPDPIKHPLLRTLVEEHFGQMCGQLPEAVFVPLGPVPAKALAWLSANGVLSPNRVLDGLPHPSGANAERIAYFLGRKARNQLSSKTSPEKLDASRERLANAIATLT